MTVNEVKDAIARAMRLYARATRSQARGLAPSRSLKTGKLYEAYVLGTIAQSLTTQERLRLRLSTGSILRLKSSSGPINRAYPRVDVYDRSGSRIAEIWTDVEFFTLSCSSRARVATPRPGDYHELDIVMVPCNMTGRPEHTDVWLGVECKHTGYTKDLLRQILGVRRELSYLQNPVRTKFASWPRPSVPADPASCLLVYSTDPRVSVHNDPAGRTFGIDFIHEPL